MARVRGERGAIPADEMLGTIDEARETYSGFQEQATENAAQAGIPIPYRPRMLEEHGKMYSDIPVGEYFDGRMPAAVKTLSLNQISSLYTLFMNWYAYVSAQERVWRAKKSEANKLRSHIEAACRRLHSTDEVGGKRSDQMARILAKLDVDFMEAERDLEIATATHDLIDAQLRVANKNLAMISREITLRGLQIEGQAAHRGFNTRYGRSLRQADAEFVGEFEDAPRNGGEEESESEPQDERRPVDPPAKAQGVGRFARARAIRGG